MFLAGSFFYWAPLLATLRGSARLVRGGALLVGHFSQQYHFWPMTDALAYDDSRFALLLGHFAQW